MKYLKDCIRYLGVMADNSSTWKQHVAHVSPKLLFQIRKYSNSQMVKKCILHCFIHMFSIV